MHLISLSAAIAICMFVASCAAAPESKERPQVRSGTVEEQMLAGIASAKADLKSGRFTFPHPGPPPVVGAPDRRAQILERYGVYEQSVGDVYSLEGEAFRTAYNLIMEAALEQKLGATFWQRVNSEVKAQSDPAQYKLAPAH